MPTKRVLIVNNVSERGKGLALAVGSLAADLQVGILQSAEEAFLTVMQSNVDLVVVDLQQPGKDSLELVNIIHARIPTTRIILIVDAIDAHLKEQAAGAGVTAFFSRPADKVELLKAAAYCLGMPPGAVPSNASSSAVPEGASRLLAERLDDLVKSLGAAGAAVYDRHGRQLALAGVSPGELIDAKALPGLLSALISSQKAGQQACQQPSELVLTLKGPAHHLLAAPLPGGCAVLVCLKAERASLRLAIALEEVLQARQDLEQRLGTGTASKAKGASPSGSVRSETAPETPPATVVASQLSEAAPRPAKPERLAMPEAVPAEMPAETDETVLAQQFTALLENGRKLQPADVDAFWNEVTTTKAESSPSDADLLSYEQARSMGLTPKEGGR